MTTHTKEDVPTFGGRKQKEEIPSQVDRTTRRGYHSQVGETQARGKATASNTEHSGEKKSIVLGTRR